MSLCSVRPSPALVCLAMLGACGSDDGAETDTTGNTELNAIVRSQGSSPVESVEYTVHCVSDEDSGAPDEVRLDGELELADSQAVKTGLLETVSERWTGFLDLLPASCSIQLRGRDDDGEVICTADVSFSVVADTATQVVVLLRSEEHTSELQSH